MKVIIAGGRDFNDFNLLKNTCDKILSNLNDVEIVSGTCVGADLLGEKYAKQINVHIKQFPADWINFGNSAGYKRNKQMAEYADGLICFWDGKSKGTKSMIELAKQNNLLIRIIKY